MADLKAFLLPPVMNQEEEVVISKRFKDEAGKPIPFKIRVIDQETNDRLIKRCTKQSKSNGLVTRELDTERYAKLLISTCVTYPDFKDAELCAYYKTTDPLDVPGRMLTVGEYTRLTAAIKRINDLDETENIEELEDEVKN